MCLGDRHGDLKIHLSRDFGLKPQTTHLARIDLFLQVVDRGLELSPAQPCQNLTGLDFVAFRHQ